MVTIYPNPYSFAALILFKRPLKNQILTCKKFEITFIIISIILANTVSNRVNLYLISLIFKYIFQVTPFSIGAYGRKSRCAKVCKQLVCRNPPCEKSTKIHNWLLKISAVKFIFFQNDWRENRIFVDCFLNVTAYGKRSIVPHLLMATVLWYILDAWTSFGCTDREGWLILSTNQISSQSAYTVQCTSCLVYISHYYIYPLGRSLWPARNKIYPL